MTLRVRALVASLALSVLSALAWADPPAGTATVGFRITIPEVLRLARQAPQTLRILSDDIVRGYIDTEQADVLDVVCNSRHGYAMKFVLESPVVHRVESIASADDLAFNRDGVVRWHPTSPQHSSRHKYRYRLWLSAAATPGDYAWPVMVSLQKL